MNRQTMHCPSCGTEISTELKFCRSCGMGLEMVSKAMAEHLSAHGSDPVKAEADKRTLQRMVKSLGLGGMVLIIGMAALLIGKKLLRNEMADLVGGLIVLAGVFMMAYALFTGMWWSVSATNQKGAPGDHAKPELAGNTSPVGLPEPPPSVTEQTTKILETSLTQNSGKESGF